MATTSTVRAVEVAHQLPAVCRLLGHHGIDALPAVLGLVGRAVGATVSFRQTPGSGEHAPPVPGPRRSADVVELPVAGGGRTYGALLVETSGVTAADDAIELLQGTADALALALAAAPRLESAAAVAALLRLEEDERGELAHHLHDSLVQSLVAARYLADLAHRSHQSAGAQDDPTAAVQEAVQAALRDGRHLLAHLRPQVRDGRALAAALRGLLPSTDADRVVVLPAVPDPLPATVGAAAFRFVQAAVNDLLERGFEPGLVHVTLTRGHLELWVRGEPARTPPAVYPPASMGGGRGVGAAGGAEARGAELSGARGLMSWGNRMRLLGGGTRTDELSAHAWLPLSDGSVLTDSSDQPPRPTAGRAQRGPSPDSREGEL